MKKIQKIIAGAVMATMLMAPAGTVLADETTGETLPEIGGEEATETTQELTFETMYGSQIGGYLGHQYTFDGEPIPTYVTDFYFINAFMDLSNYAYYGSAPATSEGFIDLSVEFGGEYATFGDYYVAYAENTIESTMIVCKRAEEEGISLTDETMTAIDDMIESLAVDSATPQGMSLDEYLQLYFGEGMTEDAFRETLEMYYLAEAYSDDYCEKYAFTDEEKYIPNIRYALFYAPSGSSEDTLAQAEADANALLADCSDIDDMQTKAQELLAAGTVFETNDILVPKGQMVPAFEAWAYETHEVGDLDVIKSDEYGYFVVGFLGMAERSQDELNNVALGALSQEISDTIDSGVYEFGTDDPFEPALPVGASDAYDPATNQLTLNITATPTPGAEGVPGANDSANTVLIILAVVGGVAIVGVIIILIFSMVGGKKEDGKTGDKPKKVKPSDEPEPIDDPEETDDTSDEE